MYTYIKNLTLSTLFLEQLPVFVGSFAISEIFYKFGSFSLECLAFLATWYGFDLVIQLTKGLFKPKSAGISAN